MSATEPADRAHMAAALALARRGLGRTWPNPTVGCVILRDGAVVARAHTARGGRPHAEALALAAAGARARGATAYVSLEPCDHHGATPPCSLALIGAGIARAVVAVRDPDPRVDGRGLARLAEAGIAVTAGVLEAEAAALNAGFFLRVTRGRPLFTLKLALTLDGRIAMAGGASRWITGTAARARAHLLRASHDAVLIGIGTALADDPELTCRLAGREADSPVRVVVDSGLRLPATGRLALGARAVPLWVATTPAAPAGARAALEAAGAVVLEVPERDGRVDAAALAQALGARGLTRVLVEGGGALAASLFGARLVDRLALFRAGAALGAEGRPAIGALGLAALAAAPRFRLVRAEPCGGDVLEEWECSPAS